MNRRRSLRDSEDIVAALDEMPSDIDTPEELISSDDDDVENRNEIVSTTFTRQNLGSSSSSESEATDVDDIVSDSGRVWKKNNVSEYPRGFTGEKGVVLQKFAGKDSPHSNIVGFCCNG